MDDFYETSYVKSGRDGRHPRLCVTYHDEAGKRHERTRAAERKRLSALRREAEEWRAELNDEWRARLAEEEERRRREEAESRTPLFADYARGFASDRAREGIERSTAHGYRRRVGLLTERGGGLAELRIDRIAPEDCRAWQRYMMDERGLSARTVAEAFGLLRQILERAVDDGLMERNPARRVRAPKVRKSTPNALDRRSVSALREWVREDCDWFRTTVALALFTGMRRGEIFALRWRDVDFQNRVVHVRHALGWDGRDHYLKSPKSGTPRDAGMSPSLEEALGRRARDAWASLANLYDEEGARARFGGLYVCGDVDGTWRDPQRAACRWRRLCRELSITGTQRDRCTFHDLRHTFITYMVLEGVPIKSIMGMVGHSSASMTLDVYASVDETAVWQAVARIDSALPDGEWEEGEPAYVLPSPAQ